MKNIINRFKNKQTLITLLIVFILLLVTLGVSYSFFSYTKEGNQENSIKLGTITFKYTENEELGNGIIITDAFPMSDSDGKSQTETGKVFDFKVESTLSRSDLEYEVVAEPTESSTLPLDAIKFYLTDITSGTEEEIASTVNSDGSVKTLDEFSDTLIENANGKTVYQETILRNTKGYLKQFRARMWISEDIDWSDEKYMNKSGAIRINVYANSDRSMANTETTSSTDTSLERVVANDKYLFIEAAETEKYQYTVTVPNEVDTVDIDAIPNNMNATVELTPISNPIAYLLPSSSSVLIQRMNLTEQIATQIERYTLNIGDNFFKAVVTSSDKNEKEEYILRIVREENNNTNLLDLNVSGYTLVPTYNNSDNLYTVEVPYDVTSVEISATKGSEAQTITGLGTKELVLGTNEAEIIITAENGTTRTIKITIVRKESNDASIANVGVQGYTLTYLENNIYTVTVPNNITSVTLKNTSITGATVTGIGEKTNLVTGNNDYEITITSQSGTVTNKYIIRVIREQDVDNTLKSLVVTGYKISPDFNKDVLLYNLTVDNNVTSVEVLGEATSSNSTVTVEGNQNLVVGENTVNVIVTAQNQTTRTYQIIITRKKSSDATLESLSVSSGTLSPTFDKDTTKYTVTIPYDISSIEVSGNASNSEATIDGLGTKELNVGENEINIVVTAQDGTKKTYTITVTREKNTDNTLKSLTLTNCDIEFNNETQSYSCTVENEITETTVTAVANSGDVTITGDGTYQLSVGKNTITVTATSQSGSIRTFTIEITRKANSDATLKSLSVSNYNILPTFESQTTSYTLTVPYSVSSITLNAEVNNSEASVTGTGSKSLSVGDNKFEIIVKAEDKTTKTYTLTVTREQDTDNTLNSLSLTNCTLSPTFASSTTSYTCTVENNITTTTVTAEANSSVATVTGIGDHTLSVGTNTINVVVTSQSGVEKIYEIIVTRKSSSDSTLKSLTVSEGTLSPTFSPSKTEYTLTVSYSVTSLTIDPTVNNSEATVEITGNDNFIVGKNNVSIVVTAGDKTTKTYTITVTRSKDTDNTLKSLSLTNCNISFLNDTTSYTCTVENNITTTTVTAVANSSEATITGDGEHSLAIGKNTIAVTVTSQSGSIKTYTVEVTRKASSDNTLKSLTVSNYNISPTFESETTYYTLTVPYSVSSITVNAEVNNSEASLTGTGQKELNVGANVINVVVTAGDKTEKTYTITVTRSQDTINTLSALSLTNCTLSPAFSSTTNEYSCTVANSVTKTTVSATATSSVASVAGTGATSLNVGTNTINVVVTSQSGSENIYTVTVTRLANSDATLKSLEVTNQTLSPTFNKDTLIYTVTVPYSVDSVTITGATTETTSNVEGLGSKVLTVGDNVYSIKVTAQDGTTRTYQITVTRSQDTDTSLKSLSVENYTIVKVDDNHYTLTVENSVTSVNVLATATSSVAKVTGTGTKTLSVGANTVQVQVTAQNGDISVYEIVITRKASSDATLKSLSVSNYSISPTFDSGTTAYTLTVPYSTSSVTINATVNNSEASVTGTGSKSLSVGSNTATVKVTAGDKTTKEYTITITRSKDTTNTLSELSLTDCTLSPTFASATTAYSCTVENSVTKTTVSATKTSSVSTLTGTGEKELSVGENTITVSVTSQSGSKKNYVITVTRKASSDATLSALSIDGYDISPTFASGTTTYTVNTEATSVNINATVNNSEASVTGTGSKSLSWGTNTANVVVTAGDGTKKTYTITITNTRPTAPVITGGSTSWSTANKTISIKTAGTALSDVKHYEYYKTTSTTAPTDSTEATGTTADSLTVSDSGTTYIYYRTVSNNGNKSVWSTKQTVKKDATTPVVTITGSVDSGTVTTSNVTLTGTVSPTSTVSGYKYQWYQIPEFKYSSVSSAYTITEKTENGETYYNLKFTKTEGTTSTWYSIIFPNYNITSGNTYKIHFKYRINSISNTSLQFRHAIVANDWANRTEGWVGSTTSKVTNGWVDKVMTRVITSEATLTSDGSTATSTPRLEIYTGDLKLTDTVTSRSIDWDIKDVWVEEVENSSTATVANNLAQKISNTTLSHTINSSSYSKYILTATTGAGVTSTSNAYIAKVDKDTPTAPTITGGSTDWGSSRTISVSTPSTSTGGIQYYQYYISTSNSGQSGGSWKNLASGTTSVKITTEGTRYIYFRAVNNAGTTGTISAYQVTKIDTVKPDTPTVTNPSGGDWATSVKITLTSSDATSGIKAFQWYENGEWVTRSLATTDNTGTITYTAARDETIRFRVVDNADNISDEATAVIRIDVTAPSIGTITPSTTWDFNNEASFTATDSSSEIIGYNVTTSTTAPTTWIPVTSFVESTTATKYEYDASWARVFHHNSRGGTVLYSNETEAKSSNTTDKYSVLGSITNYKNSSGIYEFLLEYPDLSTTKYNRWTQTLNPVTTTMGASDSTLTATGYDALHIDWETNYWGGLDKSTTTSNTLIDGSVGSSSYYYSIGAYKKWRSGIPGPSDSVSTVDLWIRMDDKTTTTAAELTATVGNLSSNTTYYLWVKDTAGNTNKKSFTVSYADPDALSAPTVSGTSTAWAQSRKLTLTAPTSTSGIARYEYYISNSTTAPTNATTPTGSTTSTSVTISKTGKYIFFRAINNAGRVGSWSAAKNLYVDVGTPTAPTITGGSTSWSSTAKTISVSTASTATSGIDHYQYYISTSSTSQADGVWTDLDSGVTSVSISTNGTRYIYFRAVSGSGKTGTISSAQTTKVDTATPSAPTVSGGSATLAGSRTFTLTAPSSESGITSYEYYISSSTTEPASTVTATGSSTSTSITINKTGTYIYFRAVNSVGTKGAWTAYKNLYVNTALLSALNVGTTYSLSPTFASGTTSYTVTVPYSVTSLTVNKTTANSSATATVTGNSGFTVGSNNTITIKVTGPDSTTKSYTIKVTRNKDTTNTLKSLSVTDYSISPTFASGTTAYTLTVEASSITINATATSSVATVSGTGEKTLSWGENKFTINVTSQSGSIKAYTLTVTNQRPTAPTITGGNTDSWVSTAPTITVSKAGSAISGVKHYEYYKSTSSTSPSDSTTATGTTSGDLKITDEGTTYIWYRTVSENGFKSAWTSSPQVVNLRTNELVYIEEKFEDTNYDFNLTSVNLGTGWQVTNGTLNTKATSGSATFNFDNPPDKSGYIVYFSFDYTITDSTGDDTLCIDWGNDDSSYGEDCWSTDSQTSGTVIRNMYIDQEYANPYIIFSQYGAEKITIDNLKVYYALSAPTVTMKLGSTSGSAYTSGAYNNQNVYITLSHSDSSVTGYQYSTNRNTWTTISSQPLTLSSNMNTNYYFRGITSDGYTAEIAKLIRIDKTKPTISSKTISGTTFTFKATDSYYAGTSGLYYCVSASSSSSSCSGSTTSTTMTILNRWYYNSSSTVTAKYTGTAGSYYLHVKDRAGNVVSTTFSTLTSPSDYILADNDLITATPNLDQKAGPIATSSESYDESGLYRSYDTTSGSATYYFRGNVTNNYVSFAGLTWRIVRINEDGTIRMILNSGINSNATYQYSNNTDSGYYSDSTAKTTLESWYTSNLSSYDSKIASGSYFCEKQVHDTDETPTFKCANDSNNHGLISAKIGLITYDEARFAGAVYNRLNENFYLYYDTPYWTMTNYQSGSSNSSSYNFDVWTMGPPFMSGGALYQSGSLESRMLIPVINLKADVKLTGSGTSSSPYTVS